MNTDAKKYAEFERAQRERATRGTKRAVRRSTPLMLSWGLVAIVAVVAVTNIQAWHAALGGAFEIKFGETFTLGGLLTHAFFDLFSRALFGGLALYSAFLRSKKKVWFDWVGVALLAFGAMAGSAAITNEMEWTLAIVVWYVIQQFQYEGIFEDSSGTARLVAFSSYLLEFAVQCVHAPITELPVSELLQAFSNGTLEATDLYWGVVVTNICCMAGVEVLLRVKNQMEGRNE